MNENVVFKEMALDEMQTGIGSRRIKMKPVSMEQLLHKVAKYSSVSVAVAGVDMNAPEVTQTPSASVVVPVSDVKPENIIKTSTLDNIEKENINDYVLQFFPFIESKPIRLTDSMYLKVGANALVAKENSSDATNVVNFPFNTPVFDSMSETGVNGGVVVSNSIDTSAVDTQKIQDTVSDAFNATEENVKKVGYSNSKAKVEKYNEDIKVVNEVPKFGHINDSIFSTTVSNTSEDVVDIQPKVVEDNKDRVVPIVAPVREEKVMVVDEKKEPEVQQFVFDQSMDDDKEEVVENQATTVESSNIDADIIDFAKAKAIIEEEKKKAASLDEKKQEEEQKLEAAVENCNEQREEYKKVCQQVREEIAYWQKANEDRQQEVQQLEEKRLQQEKIAADYAQQKAEITSLISGATDYSESTQFVKQRAA